MYVDKKIERYTINVDSDILSAISKLNDNKQKVLFVVNNTNRLLGSFTDGDFRRWIVRQKTLDLNIPIGTIAQRPCVFARDDLERAALSAMFSDKISCLPLVDQEERLIGVARQDRRGLIIGNHNVSDDSRALIVAEIGNNHNGSFGAARRLVDEAIDAGADCVKFQMRDLESLYVSHQPGQNISADLGTQYVLDLLSKYQLTDNEFQKIFDYCFEQGITILCTPFDRVSADKLESFGVEAYKVASADLTNHEFLSYLSLKNKPLICSTGMSSEEEIISAVNLLESNNANFVLLHCNSTYPTPFDDVNLNYLRRLREISGGIVGYSGHERDINVAVAAVALGAKVIEKHFTLDKTQEGNDHKISLLPNEFARMVEAIRQVERSMTGPMRRVVTQGEMMNREVLGKSIVAGQDIEQGHMISESMIEIRSPGKGLAPYYKDYLVGRIAKRHINKNDFFYMSDLSEQHVTPRNYKFKNVFGIPVRYHDLQDLAKLSNIGLVEFHFSYKDLDVDISSVLAHYDIDFVVHAPELFSGDHLLDLCAYDETYRKHSIAELQRVIDITLGLKPYFSTTDRTLIVVNVGGFTTEDFCTPEDTAKKYKLFLDSYAQLNTEGVELIPQTMPPYPWHFGGQQFHNLFVEPDEIIDFCEENNFRICLDISHTALACNFKSYDLYEVIQQLAKYAAHIHIADASDTRKEGLQIGEGTVDMGRVMELIANEMPTASWIPEIWQGHKNFGEGFWIALDRLEALQCR